MLSVSDEFRALLVSEFRYVVARMRSSANPIDKAYYMSGTYGTLMHAFNIHMDKELVFAHEVLNRAQTILNGRVAAVRVGQSTGGMPGTFFTSMENDIEEIANRWERKEEITDLLQHIALSGYAATGNGYYLYEKGQLQLSEPDT